MWQKLLRSTSSVCKAPNMDPLPTCDVSDAKARRIKDTVSLQEMRPVCVTPGQQETEIAYTPSICRLPDELLMGIFWFCVSDRFITPRKACAPLLLTQICNAWREIVLSMPSMWSSIHLDLRYGTSKLGASRSVELASIWLGRSGNSPLSLSLHVTWNHNFHSVGKELHEASADAAVKIAALYFRHLSRWRHVQFFIEISGIFKQPIPFDISGEVSAPMLESLDVEVVGVRQGSFFESFDIHAMPHGLWKPLGIILQSVPRLHHFSFSIKQTNDGWHPGNSYLASVSSILHPPYSQLTYLDIDTFDNFGDVFKVLRLSEHLVECRLGLSFALQWSQYSPSDVILPYLRSLSITLVCGLRSFLSHLTLPGLQYLAIKFDADEYEEWDDEPALSIIYNSWPQPDMTSFLTRSSCPLEELRLINLGLSEDDLIECLEHTSSSLIAIVVHECWKICVEDTVLARLSCCGKTSFLCPKLETIEFRNCNSFSNGALADMVGSRWESSATTETSNLSNQLVCCARPESIIVELCNRRDSHKNTNDINRLEILEDQGLYVSIW
jgi:hypothetical protein